MKDVERTVAAFKEGLNCAQAVVSVYAPAYDLKREAAVRAATAFGGGLGHTGRTCGAVTGALMVIGLHCSKPGVSADKAKRDSYALAQNFLKIFEDRHGSTECRVLIGLDISTIQATQAAREKNVFTSRCPDFVRSAAEILEELLKD